MQQIMADEQAKLRFVVADTPARHYLKGLIAHSGRFSCECCLAEGVTKPAMNWPFCSEYGKELRNDADMKFSAE